MATVGGGDTWVACLAYSPDGSKLVVGDRPTRPLCTFGGDAPVNENGGLIRIVDVASRRVTRTIRPAKQPRHEYEIVSVGLYARRPKHRRPGQGDLAEGWRRSRSRIPCDGLGRSHRPDGAADRLGKARRLVPSHFLARRLDVRRADACGYPHLGRLDWPRMARVRWRPRLKPDVLTFSPDAKTIAMGEASGEVGLWEIASGRRIARFPGHRKIGHAFEVNFLAFSPNGRTLACGGLLRVEIEAVSI